MTEHSQTKKTEIEQPEFLLDEEYTLRILSETGCRAGTLKGHYLPFDHDVFSVEEILISPEYLSPYLVYSAFYELIKKIPAPKYSYIYDDVISNDPYYAAANLLKFSDKNVDIEKKIHGSYYEIKLNDISKESLLLMHRYANANKFDIVSIDKGCRFQQQIHNLEQSDPDAYKLSPFRSAVFDPEISFLITDRDNLTGWVLCGEQSKTEVVIQSFYVRKDSEKKMIGPRVIHSILLSLKEKYEKLYFYVREFNNRHINAYKATFGNRMSVVNRYCELNIIQK